METPISPMPPAIEIAIARKLRRGTQRLSRKSQRRLFLALLVAVDVLMLALAFTLAYVIRFHTGFGMFREDAVPQVDFYLRLAAMMTVGWLSLFWVFHLYDWDILLGGTREYSAVFQASLAGILVVAIVQFMDEDFVVARGWVGLTWVLAFLLVATGRFWVRRLGYAARRHGYLVSPVLVVGANQEGRLVAQQLLTWPTSGLLMLGFLDDTVSPGSRVAGNLYVLGPVASLDQKVREYGVENLLLAASALPRDAIAEVFRRYGHDPNVKLHLSSGLFEVISSPLDVHELAYVPLIGIHHGRLAGIEAVLKTILDYALTLTALAVLWPVMLVIAARIKLDSPGPVFHRRRVMGLNGRQFDALKFRTMVVNGDAVLAAHPELQEELARAHKLKVDPRITPSGHFLRKFSLDELPQLFNVLKRDMSLVGPRMITAPELDQYQDLDMNLLTVRPGLTGLWQVSGRSDIGYADRVRLDTYYIRNYSIWLDLQIIWQTIPVVLGGKGAY